MKKIFSKIKIVGIRDLFVFGGLGLMGYGLHLYEPWVAFAVCGACLTAFGLFFGGERA